MRRVVINNYVFQLPFGPEGNLMVPWHFLDQFEPLVELKSEAQPSFHSKGLSVSHHNSQPSSHKTLYLPVAAVQTCSVDEWMDQSSGGQSPVVPSPHIRWKEFLKWDNFQTFADSKRPKQFPDLKKVIRKIERDLGPVPVSRPFT
jgi:hypothetical protein